MATVKRGTRTKAAPSRKPQRIDAETAKRLADMGIDVRVFKVVATRKPTTAPAAPPVDRRTDERRLRVLQLWGKKSAVIAKQLLEEGFAVDCGDRPITQPLVDAWEARRAEAMRRNVDNDREWWREQWRERSKVPKSAEQAAGDAAVDREEYLASLATDLDDIDDLITSEKTKATSRAMLVGEKRQTRTAIAKAKGVDAAPTTGDEGAGAMDRPFFGVIFDGSDLPPEAQAKIDEWRKRSEQRAAGGG